MGPRERKERSRLKPQGFSTLDLTEVSYRQRGKYLQ
jgi:hypothetical protein